MAVVCKKVCGSKLFVYKSVSFLIREYKINLLMFIYMTICMERAEIQFFSLCCTMNGMDDR